MSQWRKAWQIVGSFGLLVGLAACEGVPGHYPGGSLASIDKFVYPSTTELPQTVTLVDTRSGQAIWSKDIPVGWQLVMRFYPDKGDDPTNPDRLDWQIMEKDSTGGRLNNQLFVPDSRSRRLDTSFRAAGELPPSTDPLQTPPPVEDAAPAPAPAPEAEPTPPVEPAPAGDPAPIDLPDNP